jgi:hypothetical protein
MLKSGTSLTLLQKLGKVFVLPKNATDFEGVAVLFQLLQDGLLYGEVGSEIKKWLR